MPMATIAAAMILLLLLARSSESWREKSLISVAVIVFLSSCVGTEIKRAFACEGCMQEQSMARLWRHILALFLTAPPRMASLIIDAARHTFHSENIVITRSSFFARSG